MKRKVASLGLFVLLVAEMLPLGFAQTNVTSYTWAAKLKRGILNIVTSPVEVARDIHTMTEEKNLLVGWTIGLVKGMGEGFVRFVAGAVDLLTFPFDFPESHKGPLLEPEFVWQKPGPKYV